MPPSRSSGAFNAAADTGRAESQFIANMSHELRTQLNAITGFSEILEGRAFATSPERNRQYAGLVLQTGRHLLGIVNALLDMVNIEARQSEDRAGARLTPWSLNAWRCWRSRPVQKASGCRRLPAMATAVAGGLDRDAAPCPGPRRQHRSRQRARSRQPLFRTFTARPFLNAPIVGGPQIVPGNPT